MTIHTTSTILVDKNGTPVPAPSSSINKTALGVGLGLGIPLALVILGLGIWFCLRRRSKPTLPIPVTAQIVEPGKEVVSGGGVAIPRKPVQSQTQVQTTEVMGREERINLPVPVSPLGAPLGAVGHEVSAESVRRELPDERSPPPEYEVAATEVGAGRQIGQGGQRWELG